MKKTTLFLFFVSLLSTGVSAQTLTKEKAQSVAESFFKKGQRSQYATRSVRGNAAPSLKCRWSSHDVVSASSEAPTFYAFEESLGQGFVIVSGDGENSRVLGYSFDSPLPKSGEMPDGMVDMLTAADSQVKAVRSGVASASVKAATPGGNIQVYLPTASWGQRAPFNSLCFTGTGESAATGCVPTAYAILMHYHKWPICATETKVYHSASGESMTLGHTYDYANMLSSYSGTYSDAQATAVATLMRDLGWAYEVVYGTSATESGSGGETPSKLINIFKYSCATPNDHGNYATVRETLGDDTKWVQYIKESLDAGYPIPYSSTGDGGRHIFILDGYDDAGYYHFNWGWNGQGNGWFTLDAMTLEDGSDYSKSHRAYFMLKPNRPSHTVTASSAIGTMGSATVNGAASATVEEGTTITLSATPASADYVFVKWTKGEEVISRSATCEVTVTGAADYVAHFGEVAATADVEVAVTATTGGTATVNGTDAVTVSVGTKITLQATPIAGYYFVNWTKDGEVVSTEAEYSTTANTYCTYTANFAEVEKVTIAVKGSGGGYKYVGATGTETSMEVEKGSIAVVRTIPASDAKVFAYWTKGASYKSGGPIVSNKTTYEFVATESVDLYINYVDVGTDLNVPVSATSSNISGGTVTINGSTGTHNLPLGSEITLSAVAESGYRFLNWTKTTVSASALSVKSVGEVVSTEPTFTTVLTEEVTYTANFERLSVDPTPTTPPAGSSFIASDGVLRFYRLALPVTYTAYERTFGGSATDVYAFWEETEAYLNKLYIPLGICFDVVVDDKLIMKATNEIDTSADNAMGYGKELIDNQIGENAYDAGVWICYFELGANETGRTLRKGAVYNPLDKAAVFSEPDGETIAHELGHHLGVSAHPQDNGLEIEMGQSLMSYGKPRDFLSVASIKIIREAIANSNAAYYSDENRTNLVGSNAGGNYVYGKSVTGNSYPVINTAALKENYSIPKGAYFAFTIPATDADGDRLMYAFQQYEDGAKFYTYGPSTNNTISFQPSYTLDANDDNKFVAQDGNNVFSEGVGTHNFVAVVNDLPAEANMTYAAMKNNPFFSKYDTYKTTLTIVDGTPFTMSLSPNKASYAAGEQVTVTWGVNTNYFNTGHKVRILLSDNYGESFDHVLAENVDATLGTYTVTMPDLNFSTAKKQFGDFSTTVRLGMIRVEVQDELAYTLSCSDPAAADATGGFLVTGGSGEGGGEEPGEGEGEEDLATVKANLQALVADATAAFEKIGTPTVGESQAIYPADDAYFCNQLCYEKGDVFDGYDVLNDEDINTYLHTNWNGNTATDADHYIRIDAGAGSELQMFNLKYTNRSTNGNVCAPTRVLVEGSNDDENWHTLTEVSSGLNTGSAKENTISNVGNGYPYRYVRMLVLDNSMDSSNDRANGHYYFVVSGLWLERITYTENLNTGYTELTPGLQLAAYEDYMAAQALLNLNDATLADYHATYAALNGSYTALQTAIDAVGGLADKKAELQSLIDDTEALMGECIDGEVTFEQATLDGALTLQVEEPTEEFYLSTNADHNEYCSYNKKDGAGIVALVDSDATNHFHSQWESKEEGNKVNALHFLQVDLGDDCNMEKFKFNYKTRAGNDGHPYPTSIVVYGSEDGSTFNTTLATLGTSSEPALPQGGAGVYYESAEIECAGQYKSLRFTVATSAGGAVTPIYNNVYCFAMSGFGITAIGHPDRYLVTVKEDILANTGVTEDMLIATYVETTEAETALQNATTEAELDEAIAALQAQYEVLYSAKNQSFSRQELKDLIDDTQALIDACYDVKDGNKTFKYGGSLYITEQDANDAAAAVQEADDAYNLATLTQEQYNEQLSELQAVHKEFAYAVSHATLPVQITTDVAAPVVYRIEMARTNNNDGYSDYPPLYYDEAGANVGVSKAYEFGNKTQGWIFMDNDAQDGKVLVVPYLGKETPLVLASNSFSEGADKVKVKDKDSDGFKQDWAVVPNNGWYNIVCNNGTQDWYFSNHGGVTQKMGFLNEAGDAGSCFRFVELDIVSFTRSEAYCQLYNYCNNELTIKGSIVGNDDESAIGYYPTVQADAYNTAYEAAIALLKADPVADDAACEDAYKAIADANTNLKMHLPKSTKYYRVKSAVVDGYAKDGYVYVNPADNKLYWGTGKANSPEAIWIMADTGDSQFVMTSFHTASMVNGFVNSQASPLAGGLAAGGKPVTIQSLSGDGRVGLLSGNTMMHAQKDYNAIVNWETDADGASAWIIEEVDLENDLSYKTSVTKYGYAGLYLNFPVEIPDGLQAYVVSKATGDNGVATLTEVKNIIPANTGVILKSQTAFADHKTEEYDLKYSSDPGEKPETNLLGGVNYLQYIKAEAETNYYLFGVKNETVGLYKSLLYKSDGTRDDENGDHIKCSGNKIYMAYSASAGAAKFLFKFDGGVTTDLEEALFGNDAKEEIYDLQGRRVERITAPGLYIVNGKKHYVKAAKF